MRLKGPLKAVLKHANLFYCFFVTRTLETSFSTSIKAFILSSTSFYFLQERKQKIDTFNSFQSISLFHICNERSFQLQRIRNCGIDHSKELLLLLKLLLTCLRQTLKLLASCQRSRKKVHWSNVWLFIQTLV